jgi:hypothetical protein
MTTESPKPLNRLEVWVAEHSAPVFAILAVLIVLAAVAVFYTFQQSGEARDQVNVLKPQVTKVAGAICDQQSLKHTDRATRCAERIRIGLVNCKRVERCRAALLAAITYPPPAHAGAPSSTTAITTAPTEKGGATQQPSNHGHQQPGPSGGQQEGGQEASPAPSEPEGGSEGGQGQESPGNGAQGSQDGSSSSGVDVEVCALERTCVGVEVGVDPKGLLP